MHVIMLCTACVQKCIYEAILRWDGMETLVIPPTSVNHSLTLEETFPELISRTMDGGFVTAADIPSEEVVKVLLGCWRG